MHKIISKACLIRNGLTFKKQLNAKIIQNSFSTMPPNIMIRKSVEFQYKLRSIVTLRDLYQYLELNKQDIIKYGKVIMLEYFNQYPMQSYRRSRDQFDNQKRAEKMDLRKKIYSVIMQFKDLNFYQLNLRYTIYKKLITYYGAEEQLIQKAEQDYNQIKKRFTFKKQSSIDLIDSLNWLYMLPLGYASQDSDLGLQMINQQFADPKKRQFFCRHRGNPVLIKRLYQKNWQSIKKFKNIVNFIIYEMDVKQSENPEEVIIMLERIVQLKLHLVGNKVIPKIVDNLISYFQKIFDSISKNIQSLLKIFSAFRYLPINYNTPFFTKLHNHCKGLKDLPSHLLLYLPYNKLSQNQVSYLQSKMFTSGRQDISLKLVYTIYGPNYKQILTPFMIKQAYHNMLDLWNKDNVRIQYYYQIYLSLIYRFYRINSPVIDQNKLRFIFLKLTQKAEISKFEPFKHLSIVSMISYFELLNYYKSHAVQQELYIYNKMKYILEGRQTRNSSQQFIQQCLMAVRVHFNAQSSKSKMLLNFVIQKLNSSPQTTLSQKCQLLFLLEKSQINGQSWSQTSNTLFNQVVLEIQGFVEQYIKYDQKTLKLTCFIYNKLQESKADLSLVIELTSTLNIKLITSLKGKLISQLKRYLNQLDLSRFNILKCNTNSLINAYRLLFNFKDQIAQFMQYFSIKLIETIHLRIKNNEYIPGKQFSSVCIYIMQTIKNIQFSQKANIIEQIVSIIRVLRKKQGIYLKVYQLDFLSSNKKYLKINNNALELQSSEILQTLKNTQRHQYHKDLYLIAIKLHCLQFIQLNGFDLKYFIDICAKIIDNQKFSITQIKQCFGYQILNCQNPSAIQKLKLFLKDLTKLAFRRQKHKHNYFVYQYFLKFFNKIQQKQMISQITERLLSQKLYPVEISNIVPILNNNEIKNKKFINRILEIMALSQSYLSYQKIQILSWLQKILYQLPKNNSNLNQLINKINSQMSIKCINFQQSMKLSLNKQQRSIEEGFIINDQKFNLNYQYFIQYAWHALKNKSINTPHFKFICRYLFFQIQNIKQRLQNTQQGKKLSKIKLYHILKYIKDQGYFNINNDKLKQISRQTTYIEEKMKKLSILKSIQKNLEKNFNLNVNKIQSCQKLQNILNLKQYKQKIQYKNKCFINSNNSSNSNSNSKSNSKSNNDSNDKNNIIVEYFIQQNNSSQSNFKQLKNTFIIHTVKKYHNTYDIIGFNQEQIQNTNQRIKNNNKNLIISSYEDQQQIDFKSLNLKEQTITNNNQNNNNSNSNGRLWKKIREKQAQYIKIQQTDLSLDMEPDKQLFTKIKVNNNVQKNKKVNSPLFSPKESIVIEKQKNDRKILKNNNTKQQLLKKQKQIIPNKKQIQIKSCLPILKATQNICKNYNGYLKIEKSLIQLITGYKCIIYDPQRNIFFQ